MWGRVSSKLLLGNSFVVFGFSRSLDNLFTLYPVWYVGVEVENRTGENVRTGVVEALFRADRGEILRDVDSPCRVGFMYPSPYIPVEPRALPLQFYVYVGSVLAAAGFCLF